MKSVRLLLNLIFLSFFLISCGGDSGPQVQTKRDLTQSVDSAPTYNGPAPNSADVQNFRLHFWDNVVATNRCGQCHGQDGQSPQFARLDDVNLAFNAANLYANLQDPATSPFVTKVAGDHNCWLASDQACGETLAAYIRAWAGETIDGAQNTIELRAPAIKSPGSSKRFPEDTVAFNSHVYPILKNNCASCHSESAVFAIAPYFASNNLDTAYAAAQSKINIGTPADSRFVLRLGAEFHNCWGDCSNNADEMQAAIQAFADTIATTSVDPAWVTSKALNLLQDGLAANAGGRYDANAIAKYEFKSGQGTTAFDTSPVTPALHLTLSGNVEWVSGWGLQFSGGKAQGQTTGSRKLFDKITATGEYAIEAWVAPANVTQEGPARIVSYSGGTEQRNFTLGQTLYNYEALNRSSVTDTNGLPSLTTDPDAERLQATLQHVVINYDPANGRRIYVNGVFTGETDEQGGGSLSSWDETFVLILGNEASNNRPWQGIIRQLVIHNRALTTDQIVNNFDVGVGQKFYLLFSIAELLDAPDTYVAFEVSQFDGFSYLFNAPFLIGLDNAPAFSTTNIRGMRIGVNGKEASVGQAFANLDIDLSTSAYTPGSGQTISTLGTIIPLDLGPGFDEFFLTFDKFGTKSFARTPVGFSALTTNGDTAPKPDIGLRTFNELNATLSSLTGIPVTNTAISSLYKTIEQQLPSQENIEGFLSSQQMAVTQLAIGYCNALVEDAVKVAQIFPSLNTSQGPSQAFSTAQRATHINELYAAFVGSPVLTTTPAISDFAGEINHLFNRLIDQCPSCQDSSERTKTIAKASCAATLGSAVTLIQ